MATDYLLPTAVAYGLLPANVTGSEIAGAPAEIGGGSVADDSDASYLQFSAWQDVSGNYYMDTVSLDFQMDAARNPTALAFHARMKNSDDVLNNPWGATQRYFYQQLNDVATGAGLDGQTTTSEPLTSLITASVTTPQWFDWYWTGPGFDPNDPTDNGGWLQFDPYMTNVRDALTGAGLRVTVGFWWQGEDPYTTPRQWLDLFEFRLMVDADPAAPPATSARYVRPIRRYPRG